jgi:hypothetical protein
LIAVPRKQGKQAVKPTSRMNLPASHSTHVLAPLAGCTLPLGHLSHSTVPFVGAKEPGEHGKQAADFGLPENWPGLQSAQTDDPVEGAKEPAAQSTQV